MTQHPSSYTRLDYVMASLQGLNFNPSQYVQDWMVCWTQFESAVPNAASYNLLNTTQPENGSYGGGRQGNIQWYPNMQVGATGFSDTIIQPQYSTLELAINQNDENTLAMAGSNQIAQELNTWGTGHAGDIAACAANGGARPNDTFTNSYNPSGQNLAGGSGGSSGSTTPPVTNPLTGNTSTIATGNPLQPVIDWFNSLQPLWDWLGNPARVLKMVGGLLLLGVALTMLVAPQAIDEVKKHPEILIGA
jgi:hypothetical protein